MLAFEIGRRIAQDILDPLRPADQFGMACHEQGGGAADMRLRQKL